ncbi:MAG: NUDIX hydrolase [Bacilli bacterium]|nr:NUDIX hydrolase [Bacilli bacterium]
MLEKKLRSKLIYQGKIIRVRSDDVILENGVKTIREVVDHRGGACALVKTKNKEILFVKQFRYALGTDVLELPAGKIEANEDPLTTITRELMEEVGIKATKIESMGYILPTPGYSSEKIYLFYVEEYEECPSHFDEDESLEVISLSISEAYQMMEQSQIIDAKTLCLLAKCQKKLM